MILKQIDDALAVSIEETRAEMVCHIKPHIPLTQEEDSGILIVGEAPGGEEERLGIPFASNGRNAGSVLDDCLEGTGLSREQVGITNVFLERPTSNDVKRFFTEDKCEITEHLGRYKGKYLHPRMYPHILFLWQYILTVVQPKAVVSMGNIPRWFFTGIDSGIGKAQGDIDYIEVDPLPRIPLVYSIHPAAVLYGRDKEATKRRIEDHIKLAWEQIK